MKENFKSVVILALVIIMGVLFANNLKLRELITRQDEIIALQTDYQYELETTMELMEKQLEDERMVGDILYDICKINGLVQEVE